MTSRLDTMQLARASLAAGDVDDAARRCAELLRADSRDVEARHLIGRCLAASGRWGDAATEYRRTLSLRPDFVPVLVDLGLALLYAGEPLDAYRVLDRARTLDSRPAILHFGIGLCLMESGDLAGAESALCAALRRNPRLADAHNNLGVVHDRLGQLDDAVENFRRAIAANPELKTARSNLGHALLRLGRASESAAVFQEAAARHPMDASVHADLGASQLASNDFSAAATALERALLLDDRQGDAAANLGEAWRNLGASDQSEAAFQRALAIDPALAEAHLGLGKLAAARGQPAEAEARLLRATELKPADAGLALAAAKVFEQMGQHHRALDLLERCSRSSAANADVDDARGALQLRFGHFAGALESFERALAARADRPDSLLNRGRALESLGLYAEAIDSLEQAASLRPAHLETIAALASCAFRICDWARVDAALALLLAEPLGLDYLHPFLLLAAELPPGDLANSLRRRGRRLNELFSASGVVRAAHTRRHGPLRVAYVSPDFRDHPVAHVIAGVIDRHDRNTIIPIGVSLTAADDSGIGHRLRSSFDEFIDASSMTDLGIANLMRDREIDVAIDLAGHTAGARPAVFWHRAAPVQVGYAGFPASTGCDFMDFIIADDIVLPRCDESFYVERVLRMPHCYLPFDCGRPHSPPNTPEDAGLPPTGFVLCAFNNGYKITRRVFDLWMRLLRQIPDGVLWLRSMGPDGAGHLMSAAATAGIARERLIFAPYLADPSAHLARLQRADVFLDTTPYNAHSSAADALWVGLPVVTCRGRTFAGSVGASLLTAVGLPELIAADLNAYESLVVGLARSPGQLAGLKVRLRENRATAPLFDTDGYTRDLEKLLIDAAASKRHPHRTGS